MDCGDQTSELNYDSPESYVKRALNVYEQEAFKRRDFVIAGSATPETVMNAWLSFFGVYATINTTFHNPVLSVKLNVLGNLLQYDRKAWQVDPKKLADYKVRCAAWASRLEYAKNNPKKPFPVWPVNAQTIVIDLDKTKVSTVRNEALTGS